ncbi:hypothetical protein D3C78_1670070 [compost metagenome]
MAGGAHHLAGAHAGQGFNHLFDFHGVHQKARQAQGITHAGLEHELPLGQRVAQVARLEIAVVRDGVARGLGVVQIALHQAGRQDFNFA